MNKFVREVSFIPAYDKTDSDPRKNYGVHGVDLLFKLSCQDEQAVLVFTVFSGWMLPHVVKRFREASYHAEGMGADVTLHKLALNDTPHDTASCQFVKGPCKVLASSALTSDELFQTLVSAGGEALWTAMEKLYESWIESH